MGTGSAWRAMVSVLLCALVVAVVCILPLSAYFGGWVARRVDGAHRSGSRRSLVSGRKCVSSCALTPQSRDFESKPRDFASGSNLMLAPALWAHRAGTVFAPSLYGRAGGRAGRTWVRKEVCWVWQVGM